jgi:hypothetical protein
MFFLDPRWANTAGGQWRRPRLRRLLQAVDDDVERAAKRVARRLMTVEFHAYHARRYQPIPVTLPSQYYTFELVRRGISQGKIIVVARGERQWRVALRELQDYDCAFTLVNPQSTYVTPASLGRGGQRKFDEIVAAMT